MKITEVEVNCNSQRENGGILKGRDKDVSEKKFLILDEKYDMVRPWAHNKRGRETAEKAMEMSVEKRRREGNR